MAEEAPKVKRVVEYGEPTKELVAGKLKAIIKEGGKRGVEIEGACDMGGLSFFCTSLDIPAGDLDYLVESMKGANNEPDPGDEERKGCSGHIGKMFFSAGDDYLAIVAYVPDEKTDAIVPQEWMEHVLKMAGGTGEIIGTPNKNICKAQIVKNGDANMFPLKLRDPALSNSLNYLRSKKEFPEDTGDDSDECCFGDDDFPSM